MRKPPQQRKAKETPAEGEQTNAQKRRIKAAAPDDDPGDEPPPDDDDDDDDQPWEIYHYRPHIEVTATLVYESQDRGIRLNDLESSFNLDINGTRKPFVHGEVAKVHASVQTLQQDRRRVREIRAEQIERLVGTKATVFRGPHHVLGKESCW